MKMLTSSENFTSPVNTHLEIKMFNFWDAKSAFSELKSIPYLDEEGYFEFSASAFFDSKIEDSECCLVVEARVSFGSNYQPKESSPSWVVSVVDIEGENRFPRSFTKDFSKKYYDIARYLKRSFILNKADDLLPEGVLTLRCDICYEWHNLVRLTYLDNERRKETSFHYIKVQEQEHGTLSRSDSECFDDKNRILGSVILDHTGMFWGTSYYLASDEEPVEILSFETRNGSFNLMVGKDPHHLGNRLLNASPVFRKCLSTPTREQREKLIKVSNFYARTFLNVCCFLREETLPDLEYDELVEVYKFAHLYLMEELCHKCAEALMSRSKSERDFNNLQEIANLYSDDYLSELSKVPCLQNEPHLTVGDSPYSDCFI